MHLRCKKIHKHGYVSFWNLWIPCFQGHKAVHQVGIDSVTSTGHLQVFPYFDPQVWMQKHTSSLQETAYIMSYHIISTYRIQIDQITKIHPGRLTWNLKMMVLKMILLFNWWIFRFHVNFPGSKAQIFLPPKKKHNKNNPSGDFFANSKVKSSPCSACDFDAWSFTCYINGVSSFP